MKRVNKNKLIKNEILEALAEIEHEKTESEYMEKRNALEDYWLENKDILIQTGIDCCWQYMEACCKGNLDEFNKLKREVSSIILYEADIRKYEYGTYAEPCIAMCFQIFIEREGKQVCRTYYYVSSDNQVDDWMIPE